MADDFTMAEDASGVEIRAKEIGGALYQFVIPNVGAAAYNPWDGVVMCTGYDTPDEAASQDPVSIAAVASADGAPTPVDADGDVVRILADRYGRLWRANRATGKTPVKFKVAYSASQTAATVYTPASGKKLVIAHLVVSGSAAGSIYLFDGTDDSSHSLGPVLSLAANGGWEAHFSDDFPWASAAADSVLKYTSGAGAAGSIWGLGWEE